MSDSDYQVTKNDQKVSAGCSKMLNTCDQRLIYGTLSTDSNQSTQTTHKIGDVLIETNNDQDTSNSRQIVRLGSTAAERNRLYRERHREKINQRRRDIRNRKKYSHEIQNPDAQKITENEQITNATSNNQLNSISRAQRQQRYYEKHKDEINRRKRDSRLKPNRSQSIPLTAAERNRNYRERKRQQINERRRDSRLLQQNTNDPKNKDQVIEFQNVNVLKNAQTSTPITSEIRSHYESHMEMKQSTAASSPGSIPSQTQHLYDFADDMTSVSVQNYTSPAEDHEMFGAFIASELRGLGNNHSLLRTVKKKIQLIIIEAYEAENCRQTSTQTNYVIIHQPHPPPARPEEPSIKVEHTDGDDAQSAS